MNVLQDCQIVRPLALGLLNIFCAKWFKYLLFTFFQKVKLLSFEEQFEEKVQQVDFKYQQKINDLITQNIELR